MKTTVDYDQTPDYGLVIQVAAGALVVLSVVVWWNRKMAREILQRKLRRGICIDLWNRINPDSRHV